jgi:glucokinase
MGESRNITIDMGGTNMRIAHVAHDLLDLRVLPAHAELPRDELKSYFLDSLQSYVRETGIGKSLASVNIAIAGQIDSVNGIVLASPNLPSLNNAPLKEWILERFPVAVSIDNDVRAAALGEIEQPALRGIADVVCLYWGTGIGGGIIANGRLLRGVGNAAGEVGHTVYLPGGRYCHCGKQGCFEAYAGGWAIGEMARETAERLPDKSLGAEPTTADLFRLAARGVPAAIKIRDEAARTLGVLAANLVVTFNPGALVIGGGLAGHFPEIKEFIDMAVEEYTLPVDKPSLIVKLSDLGDRAGLWGAAKLGLHR